MSRHIVSVVPASPGWWAVEPLDLSEGVKWGRTAVAAWAVVAEEMSGENDVVAMVVGSHVALDLADPRGYLVQAGSFDACDCPAEEQEWPVRDFCMACAGERT